MALPLQNTSIRVCRILSRLRNTNFVHYTSACKGETQNKLLRYLQQRIKATGPITVAEYMKEVLINPHSGYYMHQDVFGVSGDFITSPEISQMFGELIAVWFYNEWSRLRQPRPLQIVELGPGRGTLADDILRVFSKLNRGGKDLSLHLVEISPFLRKLQKQKLCLVNAPTEASGFNDSKSAPTNGVQTKHGVPITWHHGLETVPDAFSLFLAHEFFDAMPIHKFQRTPQGWREVLIDCSKDGTQLRYVLSKGPTLASNVFVDPEEKKDEIEVSPESGRIIEQIALRTRQFGGISLIGDYGYVDGEKTDTFRAFRNHKLHDPLSDPGFADLTADVDFSYLIKHLGNEAVAVGPATQASFLKNMGIDARLQRLLQNATDDDVQQSLRSGHEMLLDPHEMGGRYKFLAIFPHVLKDFLVKCPPAGFS